MRIVVTDACIFIDLMLLDVLVHFFGLDLDVHTTIDVLDELFPEDQAVLSEFQKRGRLTVHTLSAEERLAMDETKYPRALSPEDRSVLFLASQLDAVILSSDKAVRNYSKKKAIEYHGMLWVFDQLVLDGVLEKPAAIEKLQLLLSSNIMYRNNTELQREVQNRVVLWGHS